MDGNSLLKLNWTCYVPIGFEFIYLKCKSKPNLLGFSDSDLIQIPKQ